MSKYNTGTTRPAVRSPIVTETAPSLRTAEGAPGFQRDPRSELFLLAVSNMAGERTFYENAGDRDARFEELVAIVAVEDGPWMARFLPWLRNDANMRSASLVAALEAVRARLAVPSLRARANPGARTGTVDRIRAEVWAGDGVSNRQLISSVMLRADEPGEALAYWTARYGRAIPKPIKRGIADAVARLYNEWSLLKYDTASKGYRFGDVIDLVHPEATANWQGDLFKHALDRRHNRDNELPASLKVLRRNAELRGDVAMGNTGGLYSPERLGDAGMTWEDALSLAGKDADKARLWSALIPSMGYMALLRNLRNFDQAGVPDDVAKTVAARLADPEQVARSRQLPMRFLSAYRAAPSLRWSWALEQAIGHSLATVPKLTGRTLILVDRSGSMWDKLSERSDLTRADAAAIFGSALALRAEHADLIEYGSTYRAVKFDRSESLLPMLGRYHGLGGTETAQAIASTYREHDRVVIVTDEQAYWHGGHDVTRPAVPEHVPVYTWNLAGYKAGHAPSGLGTRHTFGGLSDAAFSMIPLLDAGRNATWPF